MLADAARLYREALRRQPDHFTALHDFGVLLHMQGQNAEALTLLDRAALVDPLSADALTNRGIVLMALGQNEAAVASFDRAIEAHPRHTRALFARGKTLLRMERHEAALASLDRAIELDPANSEAFNDHGAALCGLGRSQEALASLDRAVALQPDFARARVNRGIVLQALERHEEALASFDRAVALDPRNADAFNNRGGVLQALNRWEEALASYEAALALRPDHDRANFNRSLCLLALGDFARGWPQYEYRWQTPTLRACKREFVQPLWLGDEDPAGRTILLHGEQGFGDIVQFCRYVPLVAARTKVILQVPGELMRLMATLDEGGELVAFGDELPDFDLHCPLLSLPLAFHTTLGTIPAQIPYLRADAECNAFWRDRLADLPGLKVGLVWAGASTNRIDRRRSMALATMAPLAGVAGCSFVSLQKGEPATEAVSPPLGFVLHDFTAELGDFADTAAMIANLDLVISVDTAVVHLAGALGKPIWLLNRFGSCWRWLLERDDSPWYPTLRQFRQPSPGDWAGPISRVVAALNALAAASANKKGPA
jgi:tetratricopeptide (TPR) repeat protein